MDAVDSLRVVLAHDWLTGMRGGEKCLEVACRRWPKAPLYTLLHRPGTVHPVIEDRAIITSWLQQLPAVHRYYRFFLPLMPAAADRWRVPACDLVVSFSHCVAKGVKAPSGVPHVCYCFTPMRYAWHLQNAYFDRLRKSFLKASVLERTLQELRDWDRQSAARVTHFIAISQTVQQRIRECYGRSSEVIYPPVNTDFYCPARIPREDFYLVISAFAPYKRLDLAIEACNRLKRPLVIIGSGQEENRLRTLAGPTVSFLGWQPDTVLRDYLRRCRALLFPGEEDFGIVPLEAHACGTPVIALGRGGATETVLPPGHFRGPTGLWFEEQTADCLAAALGEFEAHSGDFSPAAARRQALRFNPQRFENELFAFLHGVRQQPALVAARQAA